MKPPPASKQALKALGPKERKSLKKAQSKHVKGLSLQLSFPKRVNLIQKQSRMLMEYSLVTSKPLLGFVCVCLMQS